jgi:Cu+-exporting ATPase
VLSQIIELMKKAQAAKPNIQKLGDKVAAVFVPIVIGIAFLTFFIAFYAFDISLQKSILNSIAVLVISCPCAMGLATPTAVMVGLGRAAKSGILIKGGNTIEEIAKLKFMVFDKTGTLTTGNFKIKSLECIQMPKEKVESIIFGIEAYSNHPIANKLRLFFTDQKNISHPQILQNQKQFQKIKEIPGQGISGLHMGNTYEVSKSLCQQNHKEFEIQFKKNEAILFKFSMTDSLKPNFKEMVEYFYQRNIKVAILTGDNEAKSKSLFFPFTHPLLSVFGGLSPLEKKVHMVSYGNCAMIGDGLNDALALRESDVSIVIGSKDLAIQSKTNIVYIGNNLLDFQRLWTLCRKTQSSLIIVLAFALIYNFSVGVLALTGFVNPWVAAVLMPISSASILAFSSMRRL